MIDSSRFDPEALKLFLEEAGDMEDVQVHPGHEQDDQVGRARDVEHDAADRVDDPSPRPVTGKTMEPFRTSGPTAKTPD